MASVAEGEPIRRSMTGPIDKNGREGGECILQFFMNQAGTCGKSMKHVTSQPFSDLH